MTCAWSGPTSGTPARQPPLPCPRWSSSCCRRSRSRRSSSRPRHQHSSSSRRWPRLRWQSLPSSSPSRSSRSRSIPLWSRRSAEPVMETTVVERSPASVELVSHEQQPSAHRGEVEIINPDRSMPVVNDREMPALEIPAPIRDFAPTDVPAEPAAKALEGSALHRARPGCRGCGRDRVLRVQAVQRGALGAEQHRVECQASAGQRCARHVAAGARAGGGAGAAHGRVNGSGW